MMKRIVGVVFGVLLAAMLFGIWGDLNDPTVGVLDWGPTPYRTPTLAPTPTLEPTATPTPTPEWPMPPTVDELLAAFAANGIRLTNVERNPPIDADSPLPRSFRDNVTWYDEALGTAGGQFFICGEPRHCAAFQSYFDALAGLAGPYTYTSPSGLVVFQLNHAFTPDQAARYREVLEQF